MSYKEIVIYLDGSPDNEARIALAISIAQAFDSRLIGIEVDTETAQKAEWAPAIAKLPDVFERMTNAARVRHHFVGTSLTQSEPAVRSRYADLLIAGQPGAAPSGFVLSGVPQDMLLSAGVPMIVTPPSWKKPDEHPIWQKVVVAWSPEREATRAVHDALPLLAKASAVTIFSFDQASKEGRAASELLRDHLGEHGVAAEIDDWPEDGDMSAIDALFASRGLQDADMIVAGAYGHSQLIERLFGGMTESLLHQVSLPVLVSH